MTTTIRLHLFIVLSSNFIYQATSFSSSHPKHLRISKNNFLFYYLRPYLHLRRNLPHKPDFPEDSLIILFFISFACQSFDFKSLSSLCGFRSTNHTITMLRRHCRFLEKYIPSFHWLSFYLFFFGTRPSPRGMMDTSVSLSLLLAAFLYSYSSSMESRVTYSLIKTWKPLNRLSFPSNKPPRATVQDSRARVLYSQQKEVPNTSGSLELNLSATN